MHLRVFSAVRARVLPEALEGGTMSENRSGWAVGYTFFAAMMMVFLGSLHALAGFTGIIKDQAYAVSPNAIVSIDTTQWGWIHLIIGLIVLFAGFGLLSGAVWARTVGVIVALVAGFMSFLFIQWYPVWGITMVAVSIGVIWALTAHGRDIVE
jgi:hypothetical protein